MSIETYLIYGFTIILLIVSFIMDKNKTKKGLKKGAKGFLKLMNILIPLLIIIGILLVLISPEFISSSLGEGSGFFGFVFAFVVGSITFLPAFISYPLGAELIMAGAGVAQVAGFLVTVMSVGVVYISAERKYFSTKATIYRNIVSLVGALLVVLIVLVMY